MVVEKDKVRNRIVHVASKIFTRFGFRKTSMEEIAMAAGMGKSSIYYYFKSKEEIFKAVVEKEADELREDLRQEIRKYDDPIDQLKTYVLFRMHKIKTVTNFYDALKSEHLSHLVFIEKIRNRFDQEEIKIVRQILQRGIDRSQFIISDPDLGAVAIFTVMKGLEIPLFIKKQYGNVEDRLDSLIRILFYGLEKR